MAERKQNQKNNTPKYPGPQLLPSVKIDGEKEERNWYLDRKYHKDRNNKLIELYAQWEKCFQVGKFNFTLISNLRYWSGTPDQKTIEMAISDKYRDHNFKRTTYESELARCILPAHVPSCKWNKYDYYAVNDDDENDDCFAYTKRGHVLHNPVVISTSDDIPVDYDPMTEECETPMDVNDE